MFKTFLKISLICSTLAFSDFGFAAKNCKKGKPCGNACISKEDVCHKDEGPAENSSLGNSVSEAASSLKESVEKETSTAGEKAKEVSKDVATKEKICKKGKLCGGTCIAEKAVCHVH